MGLKPLKIFLIYLTLDEKHLGLCGCEYRAKTRKLLDTDPQMVGKGGHPIIARRIHLYCLKYLVPFCFSS